MGELPVGLSELCSLTALDLGENSFRGPLPLLGLAKLKRMRSFRVSASECIVTMYEASQVVVNVSSFAFLLPETVVQLIERERRNS